MFNINEKNQVRLAVNKVGGVTKASNLLNLSNGAVHAWIRKRRVSNIDYARKLAELSGIKLEMLRPV